MSSSPLRLSFAESVTRVHRLPGSPVEVVFVGRSNVGKSSLINALANQKRLARVSNTPGRTQTINLFRFDEGGGHRGRSSFNDELTGTVVDLPGYGYAKVPRTLRSDWPEMIEGYLLERSELVMAFALFDGVIGPTKLDVQMLEWLRYHRLPHTVVATKSDKIKSSKRLGRRKEFAAGCQLDPDDVVWVSTTTGDGIDRLRTLVRTHLT